MKKIIFSFILLSFTTNLLSQSSTIKTNSKDYYLQKSKKQKTAGWLLLGGGAMIALIGGIVQHQNSSSESNSFHLDFDFTGAKIAIAGGVISLVSIPIFSNAAKNARKAKAIAF